MAPPAFGDLSKSANDLFSKDFTFGNVKAELKTTTPGDIDVKIGGNHNIENGRASGDMEIKYKVKEHGLTFTDKFKTSNVIGFECNLEDKLIRGLKQTLDTSFEPHTGKKSATFKNSFKQDHFNLNCDLNFKSLMPHANVSGVVSFKDFFVGVNAGFDTESQKFTKLNYGAVYQTNDLTLYGGVENGTNYSASVYQKLNNKLETGVKVGWGAVNHVTSFGVASKYKLEDDAFAKVKIDNNSLIGLAYSFAINKQVRLTISSNIDGKNINGGAHQLGASFCFEY